MSAPARVADALRPTRRGSEAGAPALSDAPAGPRLVGGRGPDELVRAGDALTVEWRKGGLTLVVEGWAVGSGRSGELVPVRTRRGEPLLARVTGPGRAAILAG